MENSETKGVDSSQCVRVAVNIRPLITSELMVGCTDCISVVPGEPQVLIFTHISMVSGFRSNNLHLFICFKARKSVQ